MLHLEPDRAGTGADEPAGLDADLLEVGVGFDADDAGVGLFVTHLLYPHIRRRIRLHCISGMDYRRRYAKRHPVHRSCLRPRENHQCTERQGTERQSACRDSRNPVRLENSV